MILNKKLKAETKKANISPTVFLNFINDIFSKHPFEIPIKKYDIGKIPFNGLSVCIPCFNDSCTVEKSIRSVLIKDVKNIFVMLMTDTGENLVEVKKNLENIDRRVACFVSEKKIPAVARNELFLHVSTSHVLFLDSDDYFEKGSLEKLIDESKRQNQNCIVFPKQVNSKEDYNDTTKRLLLQTTCIMQSSFFKEAGGFDERYKDGGEDPGLYFNKEIKIVNDSLLTRKCSMDGFGYHSFKANCYLDIIKFNKNIFYNYLKNVMHDETITNFQYCQIRNILRYIDYEKCKDYDSLESSKDEYCRTLLSAFFEDKAWYSFIDAMILQEKEGDLHVDSRISSMESGDNKISVIIPCYNNSSTIIKCVESCNIKGIDRICVLLMDAKSISMKEEIERINKEKISVYTSSRLSLPEARNFLIKKVSTEWMTSIDADEELSKEFINCFVPMEKKYNIYFTSNGRSVPESKLDIEEAKIFFCDSPHMLIKTKIMKENMYDENTYVGFEDYELNLRLVVKEKCARVNNRIIKKYVPAEGGMFNASINNNAIIYILTKHKGIFKKYKYYNDFLNKLKI